MGKSYLVLFFLVLLFLTPMIFLNVVAGTAKLVLIVILAVLALGLLVGALRPSAKAS